jgi:anti-sigma factor RsiW
MEEHIASQDLSRLAGGELPEGSLLEISRHLQTCKSCSQRAAALADIDSLAATVRDDLAGAGEHPADSEMAAYVDGEAGAVARASIEGHLQSCANCRETIAALREEQRALRNPWPARFAAAAAIAAAAMIGAFLWVRTTPTQRHPRTVPGTISLPHNPWSELEESTLAAGKLARPQILQQLRGEGQAARSIEQAVNSELNPAGSVVEDEQPQLSWTDTPNAHFRVKIFSNDEPLATSALLAQPHWIPPQKLRRGQTYMWQVEIHDENGKTRLIPPPTSPEALFRVADEQTAAEIAAVKRTRPDDHLLLAILYARAGIKERALDEFATHLRSHPADTRAAAIAGAVRRW